MQLAVDRMRYWRIQVLKASLILFAGCDDVAEQECATEKNTRNVLSSCGWKEDHSFTFDD